MRDVRTVFRGLWILAAISIVGLVLASRRTDRAGTWRAVRGGALGLSIGTVVVGVVGLLAFDQLFEIFHEIFFPAGSYDFDPRTDKLVQLFPFDFWQETAIVVGIVIIAISLLVAVVAGRRAARAAATTAAAGTGLRTVTEAGS
jgi:integral membrane protein (TIGR01906 family)